MRHQTSLYILHQRLLSLTKNRKFASCLTKALRTQIVSSGEAWVVDRLKAIKSFYLLKLACPDGHAEIPMFRFKTDDQGFPRGPYHYLKRLYLSGQHEVLLQVLQMYTAFTAKAITDSQLTKFVGSVVSPPVMDEDFLDRLAMRISPYRVDISRISCSLTQFKTFEDDVHLLVKQTKSPLYDDIARSSPVGDMRQLLWLNHELIAHSFFKAEHWPEEVTALQQSIIEAVHRITCVKTVPWGKMRRPIGRIVFLQEPGHKLRAVANPAYIFQLLLKPLGDSLFAALRDIPNDYTHDQAKGVREVERRMEEGCSISSIDIADATNTFPLEFTMLVLRKFIKPTVTGTSLDQPPSSLADNQLSLWETLCRYPWVMGDSEIIWSKGQPLGLYPSFAAFAFSQHVLIRTLWWDMGNRCQDGDIPYVLLGDDVCFFDDTLAYSYANALHQLGCIVSQQKSFFASAKLAQFAGATITPSFSVLPGKWRGIRDENFLDYLRRDYRLISCMSKRRQFLGRCIMSLDKPWGINVNPLGLSLVTRIAIFNALSLTSDFGFNVEEYKKLDDLLIQNQFVTAPKMGLHRFEEVIYLKPSILATVSQKVIQTLSKYVDMGLMLDSELNRVERLLSIYLIGITPQPSLQDYIQEVSSFWLTSDRIGLYRDLSDVCNVGTLVPSTKRKLSSLERTILPLLG